MSVDQVYQASPIKRGRSTKVEVEARREALLDIIEAGEPMTVRQVFYQATVRGLVEKAEAGYAKVQTDLTLMRRTGRLAVRLARRQHALAAQAAHLRQRRRQRSRKPPGSTARRCGPTPTAMSRSGWRRTRSRAWSIRSRRCTTCR